MKKSSYQTKKRSKKRNSLQLSNAAHACLKKRAEKQGKEHLRLYHGACIIRQEKAGRIFTRSEREKVYDDVIKTFF